jgi:hypothetical protein
MFKNAAESLTGALPKGVVEELADRQARTRAEMVNLARTPIEITDKAGLAPAMDELDNLFSML